MTQEAPSKDRTVQVTAGTVVVQEDDLSRNMYIIQKGKMRVFKTYLEQRITLAILGPGEIFGELSFLDAEPRNASVEALTDSELVVISGEKASDQIISLPGWVMPIFRSVFHRLREANSKLTVLEAMNELQKRNFKGETPAKPLYNELLRVIKAFDLLYQREKQKGGTVKVDSLLKELKKASDNQFIAVNVLWRLLKEHDFVDHRMAEATGTVALRNGAIDEWKAYLKSEIQSERYLLLTQPSLALLRKIVGLIQMDKPLKESPVASLTFQQLQIEETQLDKVAFKELRAHEILRVTKETVYFTPSEIIQLYKFQSIIKHFDHAPTGEL